ncbi:MAG: NF038122 family metalloprotease [Phycisphaerales bacterium]|nr:NF038122 family metalloprotease [Phycisphaerales bacterium]
MKRILVARQARTTGRSTIIGVIALVAAAAASGQQAIQSADIDAPPSPRPLVPAALKNGFVVTPRGNRIATLYADGAMTETEWETVWRPICGSVHDGQIIDRIQEIADKKPALPADEDAPEGPKQDSDPDVSVPPQPSDEADGGIAGSSFNIVFVLDGSVPVEAELAASDAEAYIEARFDDPITVEINISFEQLASGVLGATASNYTFVSWSASRSALQAGMDDNDSIQNHLPAGAKIPVRYNGNTGVITQEGRVFWTFANFRAAVGSIAGQAGEITFNDQVQWDYTPADGISGFSFQDVLIHEVGHVLGFSCGADYRIKDMDALDIFRFQRSDGGNDYNPDNAAEFATRPRLVSFNSPSPPNNNCVCDLIGKEYRMSDGDPYQCSHFRQQLDTIGLMDPAVAPGETRWPQFFSSADLKLFDAIGYDR